MSDALTAKIQENAAQAEIICAELNRQILKLGFPVERANVVIDDSMQYRLERDPASGLDSLVGMWMHPTSHYKLGTLLFHVDGSFFAEYDILQPHPSKSKWFVEAINVWGNANTIKGDPKLLPALGA